MQELIFFIQASSEAHVNAPRCTQPTHMHIRPATAKLPLPINRYHHLSSRRLPHRLDILLIKLPLHPRIRHLPSQTRLGHLLQKPQSANRSFPIANMLCLDLNKRHARVLRRTIVDAVAQVTEPGGRAFGVEVLDTGVVGRGGHGGAGDGDPVLRGGVLKGDEGGFVVGEVGEFVGVDVGEEEEVGALALGGCGDGLAFCDRLGVLGKKGGGSSSLFQLCRVVRWEVEVKSLPWLQPWSERRDQGHHGWWLRG